MVGGSEEVLLLRLIPAIRNSGGTQGSEFVLCLPKVWVGRTFQERRCGE